MFRKICNTLFVLVVTACLTVAGVMLLPMVMGYQSFAVLSGSMLPQIKVGEIVFTNEVEPESLQVGDVITYRLSRDANVTHRIAEIRAEEQCVITKGDANNTVDGTPVAFEDIVGRVAFHVPYLGYISLYMKTPQGFMAICGVAMLLLVLNLLPDIFCDAKNSQNKFYSGHEKESV